METTNWSICQVPSLSYCKLVYPPPDRAGTGAPPLEGGGKSVGEILADVEMGLDEVRSILSKPLILLTPGGKI
jgi:hypothetical protein